MRVEKAEVDSDEMVAWCESQERPFDSKARAEYVSEVLRREGSSDRVFDIKPMISRAALERSRTPSAGSVPRSSTFRCYNRW